MERARASELRACQIVRNVPTRPEHGSAAARATQEARREAVTGVTHPSYRSGRRAESTSPTSVNTHTAPERCWPREGRRHAPTTTTICTCTYTCACHVNVCTDSLDAQSSVEQGAAALVKQQINGLTRLAGQVESSPQEVRSRQTWNAGLGDRKGVNWACRSRASLGVSERCGLKGNALLRMMLRYPETYFRLAKSGRWEVDHMLASVLVTAWRGGRRGAPSSAPGAARIAPVWACGP